MLHTFLRLKNMVLCLGALLLLPAAVQAQFSEKDRALLVEQMTASEKKLQAALAGLTEEQMRFKSAPERWSIAEVAEHLTLAEDFLRGLCEQILKTPAAPDKKSAMSDEAFMAAIRDRSFKAEAPPPARPKQSWATVKETMWEFSRRREQTLAFVKSTTTNPRGHFTPFGPAKTEIDAAQFILMMSAHVERHTAQIEEVKADPKFPKK
jgi:DinB superfamily